MSKLPTLSAEQFALVSETFSEIVTQGLRGPEAQQHIGTRAEGDEAVAATLYGMLDAHESEGPEEEQASFQASALEAVRTETHAAGEEIGRHLPERIGPYRVTRFVAAGGMGTVYEAEQEEPRRRVAIKVIRLELLTPQSIRRFEAEGHLLARLRHPGIARVFAMGRMETPAGPVPYLVLEYIDGVSIAEYVRTHAMDRRGRLELLREVADAVQYAHDNAVLHRDLKPGNVLVDEAGQPHVLDFGIGRALDDERSQASLTATGLFLGTLAYMSPEQAVRTSEPIDVRVDVYGLGAVGYELLTGRPPQAVRDLPLHEAVRLVSQRESPTLETVDASISSDLSAIFSKALATDRVRRYRSVREFEEDLARYLAHEPVEARPPSRLYLVRKLIRRNRTTFALLALLLLSLVGGLAISLSQRAAAVDAEAKARRMAQEAIADRRATLVGAAWSAAEAQRLMEVSEALTELEIDDQEPSVEIRMLRAQAHQAARVRPIEGLPPSGHVEVSARGDYGALLDPAGALWVVDLERAVCQRASEDGRFTGRVLAWSHGNTPLLVVASRESLTLIDPRTRRVQGTLDGSARRAPLVRGAHDYYLWNATGGHTLVDLTAGTIIEDARTDEFLAMQVRLKVLDGRLLVTVDRGQRLDLTTLERSVRHIAHTGEQLGYSFDGRFDVFAEYGTVVHDASSKQAWRVQKGADGGMTDLTLARDRPRLAVLYWYGAVELWDLDRREMVRRYWDTRLLHLGSLPSGRRAVRYLPNGNLRTLWGNLVVEWPPGGATTALNHSAGHTTSPYVYALDWHPEGRWLASAAWDGRIVIWDTWTGRSIGQLDVAAALTPAMRKHEKGFTVPSLLEWSADGQQLLIQLQLGATVLWNVWSRTIAFRDLIRDSILGLDGDGVLLMRPGSAGTLRISLDNAARRLPPPARAIRADEVPHWLLGHRAETLPTRWVYPTRRGGRVARPSGAQRGAASRFTVWDADSPKCPWYVRTNSQVLCTTLTEDGTRLLAGLRDGSVNLYDLEGRRRLLIMHAHDSYVSALALSPDESMLASASGSGWVKLWPLIPIAERTARTLGAQAQRNRILPIVERALRASQDPAHREAAVLADPALATQDRAAARALLFESTK